MADASTSSDFAKRPSWQCSDMLAIADIGFFANMAYTRVQRKILEIRLSEPLSGAWYLLPTSHWVRFKVIWLCLGATSKSPLTPLFQRGE